MNNCYISSSHEPQNKKTCLKKGEMKVNLYFRLYIDLCACVHSRLLGGVNTKSFRAFFLSSIYRKFSFIDTMSEERGRGDDVDEAGGPVAVYRQNVLMGGIIEKLKHWV